MAFVQVIARPEISIVQLEFLRLDGNASQPGLFARCGRWMDGERESSVTYNMAEKFTYARTIRNPHLLCLIICWCFCWLVVWKATCSTNCPAWFMPFRTRKLYASLFFVVGFCSTPHSEIAIAFHWAKIRNVCVSSREIIMRRCSFGVWVCSPFVLLLLRASHFQWVIRTTSGRKWEFSQ